MLLEKLMMILILPIQNIFHRLNELSFSEQPDVTTAHDAALQKEGLLASTNRILTAPFSMRTLKNVATRNKKRKSSPNKMVNIDETADSLALNAGNQGTASSEPVVQMTA